MKKKHPEHVNLERWLVSYADFITLLFAFFVIMYAMSVADTAKFKKVSASMKAAFSAAGPVGMVDLSGNAGGDTVNPFDIAEPPGGRVNNLPAGKTNTAADPDPELQEVRDLLEESITLETGATDISDKLQMQFDSRGLIVRIAVKDFFEEGQAEIRPDLKPLLDRIGRIIGKTKRLVRLEGHTDPSEANHHPGFSSDWELSAARAANVAKYWMSRFTIEPNRLGVAGYSHFRPVSKDGGVWGRGKNRRVEFIILNNLYEAP